MGAAFGKGLTLKMGQTHVHKYLRPLLERIEDGEIDPSFIITHRVALGAPRVYRMFNKKEDCCISGDEAGSGSRTAVTLHLAPRLTIAAGAAARGPHGAPLIWTEGSMAAWRPLPAHAPGCDGDLALTHRLGPGLGRRQLMWKSEHV